MPLEVRQIGIRFSVGGGDAAAAAGQGQAAADDSGSCGARLSETERAALVDSCVSAVLAELRRQGER